MRKMRKVDTSAVALEFLNVKFLFRFLFEFERDVVIVSPILYSQSI